MTRQALFAPLLLVAAAPLPALAQRYSVAGPGPGYDRRDGFDDGGPADTSAEVAAANEQAAPAARASAYAAADDQSGYAADLDDYRQVRRVRSEVIRHNQARYDRELRAYDAAMADWRAQVDACRRGDRRACAAPAPQPGDYR